MIKIYAQNPNEKAVARVADVLRSDGVIVYPTDSVSMRSAARSGVRRPSNACAR